MTSRTEVNFIYVSQLRGVAAHKEEVYALVHDRLSTTMTMQMTTEMELTRFK